MAYAMIGTFTMLSSFLNCEHAMYRRYIKKDQPYVESKEMAWGNAVHSAFEHRIGAQKPLPDGMRQWECFAAPFDGKLPQVEQKLGITRTRKATGFWDKDVWFRCKIDVNVCAADTAFIGDFKTGGSKYEDPFELEIGALLLKAKRPAITRAAGSYIWLKENRMGQCYDLSDFDGTWNRIKDLMSQIEARKPEEFVKNKSGLCGWCSCKDCENHYVARK